MVVDCENECKWLCKSRIAENACLWQDWWNQSMVFNLTLLLTVRSSYLWLIQSIAQPMGRFLAFPTVYDMPICRFGPHVMSLTQSAKLSASTIPVCFGAKMKEPGSGVGQIVWCAKYQKRPGHQSLIVEASQINNKKKLTKHKQQKHL